MGEGFVRIDFDCFSSRVYSLIHHLFSFIGLYDAEMPLQEIRFDLNGFLKAGEGIVQIPTRKMRQALHVKLLWVFQSVSFRLFRTTIRFGRFQIPISPFCLAEVGPLVIPGDQGPTEDKAGGISDHIHFNSFSARLWPVNAEVIPPLPQRPVNHLDAQFIQHALTPKQETKGSRLSTLYVCLHYLLLLKRPVRWTCFHGLDIFHHFII